MLHVTVAIIDSSRTIANTLTHKGKRTKNWIATVTLDNAGRGGLARSMWKLAPHNRGVVPENLVPGDVVEMASDFEKLLPDKVTGVPRMTRCVNRAYRHVVEVSDKVIRWAAVDYKTQVLPNTLPALAEYENLPKYSLSPPEKLRITFELELSQLPKTFDPGSKGDRVVRLLESFLVDEAHEDLKYHVEDKAEALADYATDVGEGQAEVVYAEKLQSFKDNKAIVDKLWAAKKVELL